LAELHPIAIHLPITLILLWPVIDAVGLLLKRTEVCSVALALLLLGVVVSLVATATGQAAFDAALAKGADPAVLNTHADDANLVPWLLLLVAAVRWAGAHKLKTKGHVAAIVFGVLMWPYVISVGNSGGKLVYEHAIGVRAPR
jgi:uncharacterized membrane protein